jgi:hypothetical protein
MTERDPSILPERCPECGLPFGFGHMDQCQWTKNELKRARERYENERYERAKTTVEELSKRGAI